MDSMLLSRYKLLAINIINVVTLYKTFKCFKTKESSENYSISGNIQIFFHLFPKIADLALNNKKVDKYILIFENINPNNLII